MKAIVYEEYGSPDVLELREVGKPTPKDNEVLIKVRAVEITQADCEIRNFKLPVLWYWLPLRAYMGFTRPRKPRTPGFYLAGEIAAVGKDVDQFTAGDQILAASGLRFGACAEYTCLPGTYTIATKPANMTFEEAAAVPLGALNALHFLRKAKIQRGEKIPINGACGTIGTFAVQLAKHLARRSPA